jgi:predicted TPR repeat methyltransferase
VTTDRFADHAADWDERPVPLQIAQGVGAALEARVAFAAADVVLDFGAGTGLLAGRISGRVRHVHAVDVSAAMLARLAEKEELRGKVTAHCHDLLAAPLGLGCDAVVSAMAMHHVADTAALLRALRAELRPGGQLALADLDAEDGTFHPPGTEGVFHAGFDRAALGALLAEAGFRSVAFETAVVVHKGGRAFPIFLVTARG